MNEKTKPFDGVKMDKTKPREFKVGKKKLSQKLKNIKMFEELFEEEFEEDIVEDDNVEAVEEGLFDESRKKDLEAEYKKYQPVWAKKGFKIADEEAYNKEMEKAKKDSYKGKWGVNQKDKTVIYRTEDEIAWSAPSGLMSAVGNQ